MVIPKKKFGQNFLTGSDIPKKIVLNAGIGSDSAILEIGPGKGILTKELAAVADKVVAIEIDDSLRETLESELSQFDNVRILYNDIMKIDLNMLLTEYFGSKKVHVVANLPYYITTPIIMKLLDDSEKFLSITIMVQKEVALRMTASPGSSDYSAFTAALQYKCTVKKLFNVPRGCFYPVPNVDSAVVKLTIREKRTCSPLDEKIFFKVISASFAQRRKTLENALTSAFGDKELIHQVLTESGIPHQIRGEMLDNNQFCIIADLLYRHNKNKYKPEEKQ